jgi:methyl-accepting chemotaxis protein/hemerythrin
MRLNSLNSYIVVRAFALVVVLLACCFILYGYQKNVITHRIEEEAYAQMNESLQQRLEKKIDVGITNAISTANNESIARLLSENKKSELAALLKNIGDVFSKQSNFKGIRVQIFDSEFRTFLRNWNSEKSGDVSTPVKRQLEEVKSKGHALATFVSDADGVLLRGTAPVYLENKIIGYLQYLQGVGSISRDYEAENLDYILLVNQAAIQEAPQLEKNRRIGQYWLSNDAWFSDKVIESISKLNLDLFSSQGYIRDKGLFAIGIPLKDVTGQVTGLNVLAIPEMVLQAKISEAMYGTILLICIIVVGSLLIIGMMLFIVRKSVLNPLGAVTKYSGEVAQGNWQATLSGDFRFQIAQLKDALLTMVEHLHQLNEDARAKGQEARDKALETEAALALAREKELREQSLMEALRQAARKAEKISGEVTQTVGDLAREVDMVSQGVNVQSDRMTETAAAMEEMNSTVMEVARNASHAAQNATESQEKASSGASGVRRAVESIAQVESRFSTLKQSMAELGQQAESIGRILGVINDIADQTNLLALNAAIEAARAGDAGRGFAVVADEVRKLAEKTMTATQEVAGAIRSIQHSARNNVEAVEAAAHDILESTNIASESGRSMDEIVLLVQGTASQVDSIAAASEEQSAASEEINHAISEVTRVAAETAVGMERSGNILNRITALFGELDSIIQGMSSAQDHNDVVTGNGPLIPWTDDLALQISDIDVQHKKLVDLINELHHAMFESKSQKIILEVVSRLKEYINTHFKFEEHLFEKSGYPKSSEHKSIHKIFVDKVNAFERDLKTGRVTVSLEIMRFLKEWLVKHIKGTDRQYAPYVHKTLGKKAIAP